MFSRKTRFSAEFVKVGSRYFSEDKGVTRPLPGIGSSSLLQ